MNGFAFSTSYSSLMSTEQQPQQHCSKSYFNSQCGRMLKISCCATCIDNTRSTGSVSFAVAAYPRSAFFSRLPLPGMCSYKVPWFPRGSTGHRDTIQLQCMASQDMHCSGDSLSAIRVRPGIFQHSVQRHTHQILVCLFIG